MRNYFLLVIHYHDIISYIVEAYLKFSKVRLRLRLRLGVRVRFSLGLVRVRVRDIL